MHFTHDLYYEYKKISLKSHVVVRMNYIQSCYFKRWFSFFVNWWKLSLVQYVHLFCNGVLGLLLQVYFSMIIFVMLSTGLPYFFTEGGGNVRCVRINIYIKSLTLQRLKGTKFSITQTWLYKFLFLVDFRWLSIS